MSSSSSSLISRLQELEIQDYNSLLCGLEDSGQSWISLKEGSRLARASRSWDGLNDSDAQSIGVSGGEWDTTLKRSPTVWTCELDNYVNFVTFKVKFCVCNR